MLHRPLIATTAASRPQRRVASLLLACLLSACGTKTPLALPDRPAPATVLDSLMSSAVRPIASQARAPTTDASPQPATQRSDAPDAAQPSPAPPAADSATDSPAVPLPPTLQP